MKENPVQKELHSYAPHVKLSIRSNQSLLLSDSEPVVQMYTVNSSVQFNLQRSMYYISSIKFTGRPDTGYFDESKKKIQGNHTLSVAALEYYQSISILNRPVSEVLPFYKNMVNELVAERELFPPSPDTADAPRKTEFDAIKNRFDNDMAAMEPYMNLSSFDSNALSAFNINMSFMIQHYNELYAYSLLSTDGLPASGGHGELSGNDYLEQLVINAASIPTPSIDLLKLINLIDFDALESITPQGYTTQKLLAVSPTIMGVSTNGMIRRIPRSAPSGSKSGSVLLNLGSLNPVLTRLLMIASQLATRRSSVIEENISIDPFFELHNSGLSEHENQALATHATSMIDTLHSESGLPPSQQLVYPEDVKVEEVSFPFQNTKEMEAIVSSLALAATNILADAFEEEARVSAFWKVPVEDAPHTLPVSEADAPPVSDEIALGTTLHFAPGLSAKTPAAFAPPANRPNGRRAKRTNPYDTAERKKVRSQVHHYLRGINLSNIAYNKTTIVPAFRLLDELPTCLMSQGMDNQFYAIKYREVQRLISPLISRPSDAKQARII